MKLKPLSDFVLVEPVKPQEKTPGGILIPENVAKEAPRQGTVIAVGPGRYESGNIVPTWLMAGDVVLYRCYAGDEVTVDDKKLLLMRVPDIMAIVKEGK